MIHYDIRPHNALEKKIIESDVFRTAMEFGKKREGHPEGKVGVHVQHILSYIDSQPWKDDLNELRIIALLHDIGKYKVSWSEKGNLVGESHSIISERISRNFIDDERLLRIIKYHDKYFSFFRKENEKGRFDKVKFIEIFGRLDLALYLKFTYADSCDRSQESIKWFEKRCSDLGFFNEDQRKMFNPFY